MDQEFESDLAGGKGSGLGYLRGYGQMLAKAAVIWRLDQGWTIRSQGDSFIWVTR